MGCAAVLRELPRQIDSKRRLPANTWLPELRQALGRGVGTLNLAEGRSRMWRAWVWTVVAPVSPRDSSFST